MISSDRPSYDALDPNAGPDRQQAGAANPTEALHADLAEKIEELKEDSRTAAEFHADQINDLRETVATHAKTIEEMHKQHAAAIEERDAINTDILAAFVKAKEDHVHEIEALRSSHERFAQQTHGQIAGLGDALIKSHNIGQESAQRHAQQIDDLDNFFKRATQEHMKHSGGLRDKIDDLYRTVRQQASTIETMSRNAAHAQSRAPFGDKPTQPNDVINMVNKNGVHVAPHDSAEKPEAPPASTRPPGSPQILLPAAKTPR